MKSAQIGARGDGAAVSFGPVRESAEKPVETQAPAAAAARTARAAACEMTI